MKIVKASLCAAVAAATMSVAGAASAEVAFNVGVATDYVFRGLDLTSPDSEGQVFGGVDWSGGANLYAGLWASNIGPHSDSGIEVDLYGGWKPMVGPVTLDLGAIYYAYSNSDLGFVSGGSDTLEFKLGGSLALGPAIVGAAGYYSNDFAGSDESSLYYELNGSIPVRSNILLSAAVGEFHSDALLGFGAEDSYTTWNIGVTVPVTQTFSIDARYIGTDEGAGAFGNAVGDTFVGTLRAAF